MDFPSQIVSRLRRGDKGAFDEVYDRYRPKIFGFVLRMTGQQELAEDLTQDVFLKLATHAGRLTEDSRVDSWLFTVARNAVYSHRRRRSLDLESLLEIASRVHNGRCDVRRTEARSEAQALQAALLRLPIKDREALLLVGAEQLTYAEASSIMDISEVSLRKRVSRARTRLTEMLNPEEQERQSTERRLSWTTTL